MFVYKLSGCGFEFTCRHLKSWFKMLTNSKNNAYMHGQQLISVLKCVKQHTDFLQENPLAKEPLSLAGTDNKDRPTKSKRLPWWGVDCPFPTTTTESLGIRDIGLGIKLCRNDECESRGVGTDEESFRPGMEVWWWLRSMLKSLFSFWLLSAFPPLLMGWRTGLLLNLTTFLPLAIVVPERWKTSAWFFLCWWLLWQHRRCCLL